VSQQIQQAADRIWPSLTGSEQEELSREQQQHTQLLKNTLNSARSRRAQLEQDVEIWRDYCQTVDKVKSLLARTQFSDEPVTSLAGLHFNIQKITHALNDIQVSNCSALTSHDISRYQISDRYQLEYQHILKNYD
jgi:nesprin-1